jgi:hypothetical protein
MINGDLEGVLGWYWIVVKTMPYHASDKAIRPLSAERRNI